MVDIRRYVAREDEGDEKENEHTLADGKRLS